MPPTRLQQVLALSLTLLYGAPALAVDHYNIDAKHTYPSFEIKHLGFSNQRGRFDKTTGKVTLDVAARTGSVELIIDARSINMGFGDWDKHLQSEDFFWTEKYPTIEFKSEQLLFAGDKVVAADGLFTLHGVTKPLRLNVSDFVCGAHPMLKKQVCGAEVTAIIKRSDFAMGKYLPALGDEVRLYSAIEAMHD